MSKIPRDVAGLSAHFGIQDFSTLLACFLYNQLHRDSPLDDALQPPQLYYRIVTNPTLFKILVFTSATATFYAPSDISGIGGMRRECIRATPSWRKGPARYDCVFVETDPDAVGMKGLHVARIRLFFSFKYEGEVFPCALVEWFQRVSHELDDLTGLWVVEPECDGNGIQECGVIHLDTIMHGAHLIGVYGSDRLPSFFHFSESLDVFRAFYVNKYVDHHAHEIAF